MICSITLTACLAEAGGSFPNSAQAQQNSIRAFSWEGLSLNLTLDQMVNTLVGSGYTQLRVTEGRKKNSIYQRKTATGSNKVQFIEKNSALIKLIFSEIRYHPKIASPDSIIASGPIPWSQVNLTNKLFSAYYYLFKVIEGLQKLGSSKIN